MRLRLRPAQMRVPRALLVVLALLGLADLTLAVAQSAGLRVNTTASMPLGLYRVRPVDAPLARGTMVAICPSPAALAVALPRNYLRPGSCPGNVEPFLKLLAAVGGDTVDVAPDGIAVDGTRLPNSARLARDCQGRPLPHVAAGRYVLAPGAVWLYAPVAASWDSRYYGPESSAYVVGIAEPILIVGRGRACG